MKVRDLLALLATVNPDADVVVAAPIKWDDEHERQDVVTFRTFHAGTAELVQPFLGNDRVEIHVDDADPC